eukprot:TRINITY_DN2431_c0_g1_i1.p1 TRINITY_DN2431_c0_g1~~TRINITY_DN2431_c0_g1_i1.p1  ORF type:complete len:224 (-),score=23.03 TRINITY_DN2431_c0_g1_i1:29-700(-)
MRWGVFLIFVLWVGWVESQDPTECAVTGYPPKKPKYTLGMCRQYSSNSCCALGHDDDIKDKFSVLVDVGDECPYSKREHAPELFDWYCAGCSPDQPRMMRNGTTFLVCQNFSKAIWGEGDQLGKKWDDCGLRIVNIFCGSNFSECGDDIFIPSKAWPDVSSFMNRVKPPGLGDFDILVVEDAELEPGELCFSDGPRMHSSWAILISFAMTLAFWSNMGSRIKM